MRLQNIYHSQRLKLKVLESVSESIIEESVRGTPAKEISAKFGNLHIGGQLLKDY